MLSTFVHCLRPLQAHRARLLQSAQPTRAVVAHRFFSTEESAEKEKEEEILVIGRATKADEERRLKREEEAQNAAEELEEFIIDDASFTDRMVNDVKFLQLFKDFVPALDLSWKNEIHELVDGSKIEMNMNLTLSGSEEMYMDDDKPHDVKVVMELPLSALNLSGRSKEIFRELCGPRISQKTRKLKLTSDRYETRVYNHKHCCNLLRELVDASLELEKEEKSL